MSQTIVLPCVKGQICEYAVHFFRTFDRGCLCLLQYMELRITPDATKLLPRKEHQMYGGDRWETSVILHSSKEDIPWDVSLKLYQPHFARGGIDFPCRAVESAKLFIEVDEMNKGGISEFHANLIGWDDDEDDQQIQAIELARQSRVVVNNQYYQDFLTFRRQKELELQDRAQISIRVSPLPKEIA